MQKTQKDSSKKVLSGLVLFSDSARREMDRCGMATEDVAVAFLFGHRERQTETLTYVLTDRALLGSPYERAADRLRGLSVSVDADDEVQSVAWDSRISGRPGLLRGARRR